MFAAFITLAFSAENPQPPAGQKNLKELLSRSPKELLEAKLRQKNLLMPDQQLSQSEFLRILDRIHAKKSKETERIDGLWTASGEYIEPENVQAYFDRMKGWYPGQKAHTPDREPLCDK